MHPPVIFLYYGPPALHPCIVFKSLVEILVIISALMYLFPLYSPPAL